jgi:hypothetical protein
VLLPVGENGVCGCSDERSRGSDSVFHSSYIPFCQQPTITMSPIVAQLAGLSLADRFAREYTPFPHNASTVLIRGASTLNTAHLRWPRVPFTRSTGILCCQELSPVGGRFSFQFRQKRRTLREWTMTSNTVASATWARMLGCKGCTFYAAGAGKNKRLQVTNVAGHAYPGFNTYSTRDDVGERIVKGSTESLGAFFQHSLRRRPLRLERILGAKQPRQHHTALYSLLRRLPRLH